MSTGMHTVRAGALIVVGALLPAPAGAQAPAAPATAQAPAIAQPPEGSPPVLRFIELAFPRQGNTSVIDPATYLYYIQTKPSSGRDGFWVPYDDALEEGLLADFDRLWATNFLDDLWIEVKDAPYPNGVVGKHVIFNIEERERVKIVDFQGTDKLEHTKIDEKLRELNAQIRLDSFLDQGSIRRVEGIIRDLLAEKGHLASEVTHAITPLAGGPKLVNLTFHIDDGPKLKIAEVDFVGNQAFSDGKLKGRLKENKESWFLSFITGRGTYREDKFAEDAERVVEYYRDRGYIGIRVGEPQIDALRDSPDGKTRWVRLRIPVTEGERYRVGDVTFEGNTVVADEALRPLFKLREGRFYAEKEVRKGMEKAREIYGAGGYFEFTGYPDLSPRDQLASSASGAPSDPGAGREADTGASNGGSDGATNGRGSNGRRSPGDPPIVDVTMRIQEGDQYFVNRITFVGNNVTRDNVIRRELRLFEGGVFNTEALKMSVRRINQLGYFQELEGPEAIDVQKVEGAAGQVDVTLKVQEQNRNQLTFGAGVSQFEGFFGQLAFQTANFMGRGETFSLGLQAGSRSQNYQLGFTEPFLFDRAISGGVDLFKRELRFIGQFTQSSAGGNLVFGFPVANFSRIFMGYSYEVVRVEDLNPLFTDPLVLARNPFLRDSLLIGAGGERSISKVSPSFVHNTVDHPIFPHTGRRYSAGVEIAGLGGNTSFIKPRVEGVWYLQQSRRVTLGLRAQVEYVRAYAGTDELPIFERLFEGGEYSVRGYDIRTIGPRDALTGLVIGGNKSLLLNAEYLIDIAGPVRLVLFYDAGEVRDRGQSFAFNEFKTSTGAEIRFFMPVLNVPFRLIFAANPNRDGVLDNNLRPARAFQFRFAVGSTF